MPVTREHIPDQLFQHDGETFRFRKGTPKDLQVATHIYNSAYDMWLQVGFKKSDKTLAEVGAFFIPDGYVIENTDRKAIALICIRSILPKIENGIITIERATTPNTGKLISGFDTNKNFSNSVFSYSLAVDPQQFKRGIGNKLFEVLENSVALLGFRHSFFETGLETWLVEWYKKWGYKVIAQNEVTNSKLHTVIMYRAI